MRNLPIKVSQARAPGKLILSGEHAVVYQQPAIAMAVNKHVTATVCHSQGIIIRFNNQCFTLALEALASRLQTLKQAYADYQNAQRNIKDIFTHPSELILLILDYYDLGSGLEISLHSELPIGCGMGTSAAVILACLKALNDYFEVKPSPDELYQQALSVEHFQHGRSSGLDISMSQLGGVLFIEEGHRYPLHIHAHSFIAINTGTPSSTTGECVEHVKRHQHDQALWQAFADTTYAVKQGLEEHNQRLLKDAIQENHRLLSRIGVVPDKVKTFLTEIESLGFAGKISGAGSVQGENAGMVIVLADDIKPLQTVCEKFQYTASTITGEPFGARTY